MHRVAIAGRVALATVVVSFTAACADQPTALHLPDAPSLAKGGSARYQLRFVATTLADGGEITMTSSTDWFPAGGVALNANDPWRQMSAAGARLTLVSPTHGTQGMGTCRFPDDVDVNWSIESAPARSFAGDWLLTVSTSRDNYGVNFYLVGPRVVGGVASESFGVIQNIASNRNHPVETRALDGSWFAIEFTNTRLGFGSRSSPDGNGTLFDLPDYETACANFRIEAVRM